MHHKPLYRAIGETDSRYRRPLSASRVVDGLMLLDAVLARPDLVWLATEEKERAQLRTLTEAAVDKVPDTTTGHRSSFAVRSLERVPIGVDPSGRWLFIHLVSEGGVDAFRRSLQRYGELFAALPTWTLGIVLPPHLDSFAARCQDLVRQELASPLREDILSELKRYFKQRRATAIEHSAIQDEESYHEARFAFGAPRFEVLYRRWLREGEGDGALEVVSSRVIAQAIECGTGRVECHVLQFSYRHLSPLVASSRRALQGAEEGDDGPSQPRPPLAFSALVAETSAESARPTRL